MSKPSVLAVNNPHVRDRFIEFFEDGHKYIITNDTCNYTSVTTINHTHFPKFNEDDIIKNMMNGKNWKEGNKYWGLTPEQIKQQWDTTRKNASESGTKLHYDIECFMNNSVVPYPYTHNELYEYEKINNQHNSVEWTQFIEFIKDTCHLKPYRTEWTIYDEELKIAGSIDMVYEKPNGTLAIYDWKRSKEITKVNNFNKFAITECICHVPDTNFWHYALQLNTYKAILERKYHKKVSDLYLVQLHPDLSSYELIKVPVLTKEIDTLFAERLYQLNNLK